jgi:type II secretory pathway pseudopilin PulG
MILEISELATRACCAMRQPAADKFHASRFSRRNGRATRAFTLIEVVLAILIAVGVLVVALFFYQQTATLRSQLIQETERTSVIRLVMDRMTSELRTAFQANSSAGAFAGGSNHIQFVTTDLPSRLAWSGAPLGRVLSPATDLRLITYRLELAEGTNAVGLIRSEDPLVSLRKLQATGARVTIEADADETNRPPALLTDVIRFLHFRYWDGSSWQESWSSPELPKGVEVNLSADSTATEGEELAQQIFHRVIYLPGSANSNYRVSTNAGASVAIFSREVQ